MPRRRAAQGELPGEPNPQRQRYNRLPDDDSTSDSGTVASGARPEDRFLEAEGVVDGWVFPIDNPKYHYYIRWLMRFNQRVLWA